MSSRNPAYCGLFQKRIEGDDALLELARYRFQEAGLGMEVYVETYDELKGLLQFRPWPEAPVIIHLPRKVNLFNEEGRRFVGRLATRVGDSVYGLVVHDHADVSCRLKKFAGALRETDGFLEAVSEGPMLFIEYAAGLEPECYCELFEMIKETRQVSACIDIGHLGIWQARENYRESHPDVDICSFKPTSPGLQDRMDDIARATGNVLHTVMNVIWEIGRLGKPVHFHIHDGHPLWPFSPFGVSDHLSFLQRIDLPFSFKGRSTLGPMFGPVGLSCIVAMIKDVLSADLLSFCLEIHPTGDREPLSGDVAPFFRHWTDKTNAEKMNHWLSVILENHRLLLESFKK